jgi:hypothetical protein
VSRSASFCASGVERIRSIRSCLSVLSFCIWETFFRRLGRDVPLVVTPELADESWVKSIFRSPPALDMALLRTIGITFWTTPSINGDSKVSALCVIESDHVPSWSLRKDTKTYPQIHRIKTHLKMEKTMLHNLRIFWALSIRYMLSIFSVSVRSSVFGQNITRKKGNNFKIPPKN